MGNSVTTNPIIIMMINMTVVFAVLYGLSLMIRLIHMIDPTRKKEAAASAPKVSVVQPKVQEAIPEPKNGVSEEVVAVIAAAVAAYGYSAAEIRTIRPLSRSVWKQAGRLDGIHMNK